MKTKRLPTNHLPTQSPPVRLEDSAGCQRSGQKPKTLAQMRASIKKEVLRRRDRGRD
jgi:hypothetical protein